ncbi:hypothetical protein ACFV14_38065 [Streptomyces zaomyceticus]|uniref:hypothetical protein n=1 Tax=Streptomyces zaomyceticus TaxID=68286 RepID=UPI003683B5EF
MYDIDITVPVDAVGKRKATGRHADALDTTQREGWDFLMEMDPHFSLASPGEERGAILVRVVEPEDGTLTFTQAPAAPDRSRSRREGVSPEQPTVCTGTSRSATLVRST